MSARGNQCGDQRENSPSPQLGSSITKGCSLPLHITANYTMSRRATRLSPWQFRNDLLIKPRFDAKSHSEKHQNLAVRRNCRRQTESTLISKTLCRLSRSSITRRPRALFKSRQLRRPESPLLRLIIERTGPVPSPSHAFGDMERGFTEASVQSL